MAVNGVELTAGQDTDIFVLRHLGHKASATYATSRNPVSTVKSNVTRPDTTLSPVVSKAAPQTPSCRPTIAWVAKRQLRSQPCGTSYIVGLEPLFPIGGRPRAHQLFCKGKICGVIFAEIVEISVSKSPRRTRPSGIKT